MPKTVLKVALALVAVGLLVVAMVAILLPRLVQRDDLQATLREAAAEALGASVEWQSLEAGIFPPRLTIRSAVLEATSMNQDAASIRAASIDLRLSVLAILQSRVEVDSLVVRGAEIVVTRTAEGLVFPVGGERSAGDSVPHAADSSSFDLAIRRVSVSGSRIIVRDQTLSPAVEWRFEDFELEAGSRIRSLSLEVEMAARIEAQERDAGRIGVNGTVQLDGTLDLEIQFDELLVAAFNEYIRSAQADAETETAVTGVLSGRISVAGTASELAKIDLDVTVPTLVVRAPGVEFAGQLRLQGNRIDNGPIAFAAYFEPNEGEGAEFAGHWSVDGRLEALLKFSKGGRVALEGLAGQDGRVDLHAEIEKLDLSLAKPFLPDPAMELGGIATGKARLVGPAGSPDFLRIDMRVESGLLRVPEYEVAGPIQIEMEIESPLSQKPKGRIDVDLTAASVDYQGQFTKRAGLRAEMTTTFAPDASGEIGFESRIKLRDVDEILLQGAFGDSVSVAISSTSIALAGWSEVFPILKTYQPDGVLLFDAIEIESKGGSPARFRGRIGFEGVGLRLPERGRVRLAGSIRGEGERLRMDGMRLSVGGVTFALEGRIEDPLASRRFVISMESIGKAEANDLFSALNVSPDTVFGDLEMAGSLSGLVGGDRDFYSSLEGGVQISIGKVGGGRLKGVSFLQTILDQIPLIRDAARLAGVLRSGPSIEDYAGEEFQLIEGDFQIGHGEVNARTLRLVYEAYEASLVGPVQLPSLQIDMTGEVLLSGDLVSALGGLLGAKIGDRRPVRIPLARVTNTISEPKIEMTPKTLVAIPDLIFKATGLDTLTLGVGRALGRVLRGAGK